MTMEGMTLDVSDPKTEDPRSEEERELESNISLASCLFQDKMFELLQKQGDCADFDWLLPNGLEIRVSLELMEPLDD